MSPAPARERTGAGYGTQTIVVRTASAWLTEPPRPAETLRGPASTYTPTPGGTVAEDDGRAGRRSRRRRTGRRRRGPGRRRRVRRFPLGGEVHGGVFPFVSDSASRDVRRVPSGNAELPAVADRDRGTDQSTRGCRRPATSGRQRVTEQRARHRCDGKALGRPRILHVCPSLMTPHPNRGAERAAEQLVFVPAVRSRGEPCADFLVSSVRAMRGRGLRASASSRCRPRCPRGVRRGPVRSRTPSG